MSNILKLHVKLQQYAIYQKGLPPIGYEPKVDFEEGLRRTVDWFKRQ